MKAAVLHAIDDLRIEQIETPTLGDGEVLVKVASCGVCSSDMARIKRDGTYSFPMVPGHEYCGYTQDNELAAIYPLLPCYECEQCKAKRYQCCTNYNYTGSRCDGGFAEYVKIPEANLIPVLKGVSPQEAAMTEPAAVGMHALNKANMKGGDIVVIIGCGTIGLIAAQIARAMGASKVIPVDISEERLEIARSMGFSDARHSKDDLAKILGPCADVVVEMVGLSVTYNMAIDLAKGGGRLIFTGNISDDLLIPRKRFLTILRKELVILGTWNSVAIAEGASDWHEVMRYQAEGKIDLKPLISHQISLEQLPSMIDRMSSGQETFGKVIVNFL